MKMPKATIENAAASRSVLHEWMNCTAAIAMPAKAVTRPNRMPTAEAMFIFCRMRLVKGRVSRLCLQAAAAQELVCICQYIYSLWQS